MSPRGEPDRDLENMPKNDSFKWINKFKQTDLVLKFNDTNLWQTFKKLDETNLMKHRFEWFLNCAMCEVGTSSLG